MLYKISRRRKGSSKEFLSDCATLEEAEAFLEKALVSDQKENSVDTLYQIYEKDKLVKQTEWLRQETQQETRQQSSQRFNPNPYSTTLKPGAFKSSYSDEQDADKG